MQNKIYDAAVVPCADYAEENIRKAIEEAASAIGGLDFIKPGDKVVIKSNILGAKAPETAATTHPMMLYTLSKMLIERGASVVIGDSPGGVFTSAYLSGIYRGAKLLDVEKSGAKLNYNTEVKEAQINGKSAKEISYTTYLDDADYIINFAKLKTHGMLLYTGATKNMFGIIPGLTKPDYHYRFPKAEDFANMLVDLNEFKKPTISFIDAVMGMEGNGPNNGDPRHIGALIASKSPYHADLIATALIGIDPQRVIYLKAAAERGLAKKDVSEIEVYGDIRALAVPDFKKMPGETDTHFKSKFRERVFSRRPVLIPSLCRECGRCAEFCPQDAIKLDPKPKIDRKNCIRCFCCQEFCPFNALVAKQPWLAKLVSR
ncbi:MAG: DUF362 domain-containing protein [Christensenellaceae bacterium]|nr:DUF362 domain-containing protein [Christensenellaceae bacterium]MBR3843667.1 DUF362 domain-containing protein [Christensenellaceae bacterium]